MACIHGNPPGGCLICSTLEGTGSSTTRSATRATTAKRSRRHASGNIDRVEVVSGPRRTPGRSGSLGLHALVVAVIVVVAVGSGLLLAGIVFALLHILEILVVAGATGALGYRLGKRRERRTH